LDLDEEEERDRSAIQLLMKKYHKLWRFLFQKFCFTGYVDIQFHNFEKMTERMGLMSQGSLTKMLKEHHVTTKMLSVDEITTIVKFINYK
jgi:hypothetical protein